MALTDRATVTAWTRDFAAQRLDDPLHVNGGFSRPANSLTYTRKVKDGKQTIQLHLFIRPRHSPEDFHLVPQCAIIFPEMAKIADRMLQRQAPAYAKTGRISTDTLDSIAAIPPMLLFQTPDGLDALGPVVERHLLHTFLPHLDAQTSIADLTAAMWQSWLSHDPEPDSAGEIPVLVAAGHLTLGKREAALQALNVAYPPGTREREEFADAFTVAHGGQPQ